MSKKLPPLSDGDFDGEREKTELNFNKCQHSLELISSTEVRCKKCGCGWLGPGVSKLYEASLKSS